MIRNLRLNEGSQSEYGEYIGDNLHNYFKDLRYPEETYKIYVYVDMPRYVHYEYFEIEADNVDQLYDYQLDENYCYTDMQYSPSKGRYPVKFDLRDMIIESIDEDDALETIDIQVEYRE